MLLIVSVLILIFGLAATTRTQNITVGGYYPGVIVSAHLHAFRARAESKKDCFLRQCSQLSPPALTFRLLIRLVSEAL